MLPRLHAWSLHWSQRKHVAPPNLVAWISFTFVNWAFKAPHARALNKLSIWNQILVPSVTLGLKPLRESANWLKSLTQHYYRNSSTSIFHFTDFPTVKYSSPQKPLQGEVFADTWAKPFSQVDQWSTGNVQSRVRDKNGHSSWSTAFFTFYYTLLLFKLNLYNIVVVCWNMTCPRQFWFSIVLGSNSWMETNNTKFPM